ncbi:hypothetical protein AB1Y20_020068 [Prymnesium parvum]|uniref:VWFA domain-containing protein n=1 Tax=Prymnesium parvum TaxID=97485 RepID=A0AB34JSL3_PRYPA
MARYPTAIIAPITAMHGPTPFDSLYRSSHFALDPLLDHFQRSRHKERSHALISSILRRLALLAALVLVCTIALRSIGNAKHNSRERTLHCFFLLDRSGSMRSLSTSVVKGFNSYVARQQQQPGAMRLTLAQFDDRQPFQLIHDGQDIRKVRPLTPADFEPRGRTPLYDALAELIAHVDRHATKGSEVVVVIFSDGMENASRRHTRDTIFKMIEERRQGGDGWTFVFLGANQDSYATGQSLSIAAGATLNYKADEKGVQAAMSDLSQSVTRARRSARNGVAQTAAQREAFLVSRSAEVDLEHRGGTSGAAPSQERGNHGRNGPAEGHARYITRKLGHRSRRRRSWEAEDLPDEQVG